MTAVVSDSECLTLVGQNLRLTSYQTEHIFTRDQTLAISARLRQTWGSKNPGSVSHRLRLLGRNVRATGYIKTFDVQSVGRTKNDLELTDFLHGGVLRALATGDQNYVTDAEWQLFRGTGTVHLMVVSGLHIGVLAGLVMLLLNLVVRLVPRLSRHPHIRHLIVASACLSVFCYCAVVGMQAPVLRATTMFTIGLFAFASMRSVPVPCVLGSAWCAVLVSLPYAFLQAGFWLSFIAVGVLLFAFAHRLRRATWVNGLCLLQAAIFVGVSPTTAFFVSEMPLVGPLANIVVVPLMSAVVIPTAMIGHFCVLFNSAVGGLFLLIADYVLHLVITFLEMLVVAKPVTLAGISWSGLFLSGVLAVFCLLPISLRYRLLAISGWSLVVGKLPPMPEWSHFRVYTLDVGQGSAAIIDTARHRLVFDTGPAFPSGFNAGSEIVLPALRATGPYQLDRIVVSHADIDHSGGLSALRQEFPRTPQVSQDDCTHKDQWVWEGVSFQLLKDVSSRTRNSGSCTLLIQSISASAYLSGDIERESELFIKNFIPKDLDFMTAPHHGSRTSSHPAFVKKLRPEVVVFSAGFQNRYGHPATEVVARYHRRGAKIVWTYSSGAVLWESRGKQLTTYRNILLGNYLPIVRSLDGND